MPTGTWLFAALAANSKPLYFVTALTDGGSDKTGGGHRAVIKRVSAMESVQKEQRYLPELRVYIDKLLAKGWVIAGRNPLTLQSGRKTYRVMHGMLIGSAAF